jgi:ATP synthase protein I
MPDSDQPTVPESVAWNITATLMSGLLGFGVPGWLLAHWLAQPWIVGVALVAGMAAALTIVWYRYGSQ